MRISLFGLRVGRVGRVHDFLSRPLRGLVSKIVRITKGRRSQCAPRRFDVHVKEADFGLMLRELNLACAKIGGSAAKYLPYNERPRRSRSMARKEHHGTAPSLLRTATWNINGARAMRPEVELLAKDLGLAVVAVQETGRSMRDWEFRLPGYHTFSVPAVPGVKGRRGVALAVKMGMQCFERETSPWSVVVDVLIRGVTFVFACVYIPCDVQGRTDAIARVDQMIRKLFAADAATRLVVLGDFNLSAKALSKKVEENQWPVALVPVLGGDRASRHYVSQTTGRLSSSALDHYLISASVQTSAACVQRTYDGSDHWPVTVEVTVPQVNGSSVVAGASESTSKRLLPSLLLEKAGEICNHSAFVEVLQAIESEEVEADAAGRPKPQLEDVVKRLNSAAWMAAEAVGCVSKRRPKRRGFMQLTNRTVRMIERRREIRMEILVLGSAPQPNGRRIARLLKKYEAARKAAKEAVAADRNVSWTRYVATGVRHLTEKRSRIFWSWMRANMRAGQGERVLAPVRDEAGVLQLSPDEIMKVWQRHYERLCADQSGMSSGPEARAHWSGVIPDNQCAGALVCEALTWTEAREAIRSMARGKAPGPSGIPVELFQAACGQTDAGDAPVSALAKLVLEVLRRLVMGAEIPESMRLSHVVPIPKKGDLTNVDNYRGISLMDSLLKIGATIVKLRLMKAADQHGWIRPEQAGFRVGEECAGQIATLLEVCQRRAIENKPTYLAFLDLKKAYDSVSHEALFRILEARGVGGALLRFLRALYADSQLAVKLRCGQASPVKLRRGLR